MIKISTCFIHAILKVDEMGAFISPEWEDVLFQKIEHFLSQEKKRSIAVNGIADHVHILFEYDGSAAYLIDLIEQIKVKSALWINRTIVPDFFQWKSHTPLFICENEEMLEWADFIQQQKKVHKEDAFSHEYRKIIEKGRIISEI